MKIYLAARYSRRTELRFCKAELESYGHIITSRWLTGERDGNNDQLNDETINTALVDEEDVIAADVVINFTEEPRTPRTRGGRHVEFGIGRALGKQLVVIGPRENVFHYLPEVEQYDTWAQYRNGVTHGPLDHPNRTDGI